MRCRIITAALSTIIAGAVTAQTTRPDAGDELERALSILDRIDVVTASVNYADTSLAEAIEDLNWFLDVPLTADWEALEVIGVDADSELTLRLEDAPLATVLRAVALQLGSDFDRPCLEVFGGSMLVLTTDDATERMRLTDVYDVRDLLADGRAAPALRQTAPSGAGAETPALPTGLETPTETAPPAEPEPARGVTGAAGATTRPGWRLPAREDEDDPAVPPARRRTPGADLMTLICEHVDPDAWIEYGGTRASISERDGVLMVSAAPTLHRGVRDALRRLRRAYASFVTIDAVIVDVPRSLFDRLARRHELSSAGLGRGLLAADETRILWRAEAGVTPGAPLVFESRSEGGLVRLELLPTFDQVTGTLAVAVDAASKHDADERAVRTTVTIPYRQGGATIELPAAAAGDVVRLVVLIPAR